MTTPDMEEFMGQANDLHRQIGAMQDELVTHEIVGRSRGGAVAVVMTAGGDFRRVRIDPEVHAVGPDEVEAAVLDALRDAADQLREHTVRQIEGMQDLLLKPLTDWGGA